MLLKPLLWSDSHALGPHAVALFVPFGAGLACLAYSILPLRRAKGATVAPIAVCVLLSLLLLDVFAQPVKHFRGDDPFRYSTYAHNMLESGTLWGSDGVYYDGEPRHFVDQPGYRYYLAGMIWLAGGENRLMQLLNLLVLLSILAVGVPALVRLETGLGRFAALMFVLAAPYAAKNVVQGLAEWLAVSLAMLYVVALLRGRHGPAIALLALVPFVRQNLIPLAAALAAFHTASIRRPLLALPFLLLLLLPVYHNLYFAGELRFLVENKGLLFDWSAPVSEIALQAVRAVADKLPNYIGIPSDGVDLHTRAAALLFAPASLVGIAWFVIRQPAGRALQFVLVLALIAGPSLLFGHAYFPRFVYTNYSLALLSFVVLVQLRSAAERPARGH